MDKNTTLCARACVGECLIAWIS